MARRSGPWKIRRQRCQFETNEQIPSDIYHLEIKDSIVNISLDLLYARFAAPSNSSFQYDFKSLHALHLQYNKLTVLDGFLFRDIVNLRVLDAVALASTGKQL